MSYSPPSVLSVDIFVTPIARMDAVETKMPEGQVPSSCQNLYEAWRPLVTSMDLDFNAILVKLQAVDAQWDQETTDGKGHNGFRGNADARMATFLFSKLRQDEELKPVYAFFMKQVAGRMDSDTSAISSCLRRMFIGDLQDKIIKLITQFNVNQELGVQIKNKPWE